jgi:chaperonin cofactor prefoldin
MRECYSPADVVELTTRIRVIEENMKSLEEEYKRLLGSIRTQIIEHDNKNK